MARSSARLRAMGCPSCRSLHGRLRARGKHPRGRAVSRALPALCLVVALLAVGACAPGRLSPEGLLRQYGWRPLSVSHREFVTILDPDSIGGGAVTWQLILEPSREIGMDFSNLAGQPGEIRSYNIAPGHAVVLLANDTVVGAWIGGVNDCIPGVYPLSATLEDFESCT